MHLYFHDFFMKHSHKNKYILINPIQRFERSNNSISQEIEYFRLLGTHFWSIKLKSVSNTEFRIEAQFVQADIDSHLDHEKNILKILKG